MERKNYHYLQEQTCPFSYESILIWLDRKRALFIFKSFENRNYRFPRMMCLKQNSLSARCDGAHEPRTCWTCNRRKYWYVVFRNSVNSGNLINHWSMDWGQFKDFVCHICHVCFAGVVVVSSWSLTKEVAVSKFFTVMTNILVTEFSEFNESISGKQTPNIAVVGALAQQNTPNSAGHTKDCLLFTKTHFLTTSIDTWAVLVFLNFCKILVSARFCGACAC